MEKLECLKPYSSLEEWPSSALLEIQKNWAEALLRLNQLVEEFPQIDEVEGGGLRLDIENVTTNRKVASSAS